MTEHGEHQETMRAIPGGSGSSVEWLTPEYSASLHGRVDWHNAEASMSEFPEPAKLRGKLRVPQCAHKRISQRVRQEVRM